MTDISIPTSKTSVFIDTMIFLHFKSFDEVDWKALFKAEEVALIISPVIFTELDAHKDSHPNIKLRKRAKSITRRLHQLFENDTNAEIRLGITISYILNDSELDFETYGLNPSRRDDQQLAIILDYKQKHTDEYILLLTNDFNLRQRAKVLGIKTKKMPEEYELPDEPDPNEKLIKDLQQQILELQNQRPILGLRFDNDSDRLSISITKPRFLSLNDIQQKLEQKKNELPKMGTQHNKPTKKHNPDSPKGTMELSDLRRLFTVSLGGYSEADIQEYNSNTDQFFVNYEKYLTEKSKYDFQNALTVELNILVSNSGTAPAEDLDVSLHFPDGFELTDKLIEPPAEPEPPARPLTTVEKLARSPLHDLFTRPYDSPFNISGLKRLNSPPPNVSSPKIRRTKSFEVQFHIERVKHKQPILLRPLYLTFDSFDSAKSFGIQYKINAGNVPREVEGFLHVIIEK